MMNKQIRRMIDEIFADMKMTADNLALRDELMANAQARFEDSVRAARRRKKLSPRWPRRWATCRACCAK